MRALVSSVIAAVVFTAVFGFAYPLLMTGFAQLAFPEKADGSLIERDGQVVGSQLAAQAFTAPEYFHPRPSAVDYNAAGTSFANLGPTNPDLATVVDEQTQAILAARGPVQPGPRGRRHPRRRRHHVRLGHRPAHLAGLRRPAGRAHRRRARALRSSVSRS